MKFKRTILTFALLAMFSIFVGGFVSAAASLSLTKIQDITLSQDGKIEMKNNGDVNLTNIVLTASGSIAVSLVPNNIPSLTTISSPVIINVTPTGDLSTLKFGSHQITINANSTTTPVQATTTLSFVKSFCNKGSTNKDLVINSIDVSNSGDEDDEWLPLDEVEVEVEVDNTGDNDIRDIIVELGLFDLSGRNQVNDLDFENADEEEIDLGRLNDGDEETVTFTFRVPADFEPGDYRLAVKAFSDDLGEDKECTDTSDDDFDNDFFESISVDRETDEGQFIAFENIQITPDQVTCGDSVTVRADVFNVGDEEQDQVRVNLFSSELGIRLEKEIRENMDEGDKTEVSFTFTVPQGLKDKLYNLEFDANYDYRNGNYRESSDESTKTGLRVLDVGCVPTTPTPSGKIAVITAGLDSDARAGSELIVKATITGLVAGGADYLVGARGFESWADLKSISAPLISLDERESKDVVLSFDVNEDAADKQSFILEVRIGNQLETREIEVNIESAQGGAGITGGVTGVSLGGNSLIWIIGIINVILIILIIVVAARISRR